MRINRSWRDAWRDAAVAWAAQYGAFVVVTVAVQGSVLAAIGRLSGLAVTARLAWLQAPDARRYAAIAARGYRPDAPILAAFYPLYPALEQAVAPAAGDALMAGLVVSALATLVSLALLRALAGRRAMLYLAIAPLAAFLAVPYAEATFLALSLGATLAWRRRCWWLAGGLAALATLARPFGVLLTLALAVEAWRDARTRDPAARWRGFVVTGLPALVPLLALAGYWAFLWHVYGSPFASAHAEATVYGRWLDWPWVASVQTAGVLFTGPSPAIRMQAALDLGAIALAVVGAWWMRGHLPTADQVYTWASILLVLCMPYHVTAANVSWIAGHDLLWSAPRFLLPVFPLYIALARWAEASPWRHRLIVYLSASSFLVLVGLTALGVVYA